MSKEEDYMPAAAQEAVAWFTDDHLSDKSTTTYDASVAERWSAKGWPVTPLYAAPVASAPVDLDALAVNRYRQVPDGLLAYKVVAGDGTRSLFSGTMNECNVVARKLTEAFLDGAHVASTVAALGIDLEQFREAVENLEWQNRGHANPDFPTGDPEKHAECLRLLALIDASPKGGSDACIWTDDGEGNWATACGEIFTLIEGVPAENKVHHCPYCGKNLQATSAEVGECRCRPGRYGCEPDCPSQQPASHGAEEN